MDSVVCRLQWHIGLKDYLSPLSYLMSCRAASSVFFISIAIVIGPTPPGTGVMYAAFSTTPVSIGNTYSVTAIFGNSGITRKFEWGMRCQENRVWGGVCTEWYHLKGSPTSHWIWMNKKLSFRKVGDMSALFHPWLSHCSLTKHSTRKSQL